MSGTNSTIECLKSRRSVKSYKPDMLPKEVLQEIVEAGTWVPTGMNRQSPIILVITDKKVRDQLSRMNAHNCISVEKTPTSFRW